MEPTEKDVREAFARAQQAKLREHRAEIEELIAKLQEVSDENLLRMIEENDEGLAAMMEKAEARGNFVWPGVGGDIMRHVAAQRGLISLTDDAPEDYREYYAWIAREFAHPGGLQ